MEHPARPKVVTVFLAFGDRILLVQRSHRVGTYPGLFSAISGYLEEVSPYEQACIELREETGVLEEDIGAVVAGDPLEVRDDSLQRTWIVYSFLFTLNTPKEIRLDWENTAFHWVLPEEMITFPSVPGLLAAWQSVSAPRTT